MRCFVCRRELPFQEAFVHFGEIHEVEHGGWSAPVTIYCREHAAPGLTQVDGVTIHISDDGQVRETLTPATRSTS